VCVGRLSSVFPSRDCTMVALAPAAGDGSQTGIRLRSDANTGATSTVGSYSTELKRCTEAGNCVGSTWQWIEGKNDD
jgi:hypothetical protein